MPDQDHLVQLEGLGHERGHRLHVGLRAVVLDPLAEDVVVGLGQLDAGEQVGQDALEQRDVRGEELRQVYVLQRAEHEDVLLLVGELLLHGPGGPQHGDDGPHPVVVVALAGELLGAEAVGRDQLPGQVAGLQVPAAVQEDLGDERVVRDHHRHGAEEGLQVVGELGPPCVPGVHRDEHGARVPEAELCPLELEHRHLRGLGPLDGQDLLRDHAEHLEVDPVELVEARPGPGARQPLEELPHGQVVQAVRAVEDDALHGDRLGQVLGGLRLARPRGPLRRPAQVQVQGAHQRPVAPVRERGDDQPAAVPQVLVPVVDGGVDHPHDDLPVRVVPLVTQLAHPREVALRRHPLLVEVEDDVTGVHVDDDQGRQRLALQLGQLAADLPHDLEEVLRAEVRVLLQLPLADGLGHLRSPVHGVHADDRLARPLDHPVLPDRVPVVLERLLGDVGDALPHRVLALDEPLLDVAPRVLGVERGDERHALALLRDHGRDLQVVLELDLVDALEDLLQEGLHAQGVLGLGEDLQQLVVGEEVEPGEREALGLEVVVQALLDEVQQLVGLDQVLLQLLVRAHHQHLGVLQALLHRAPPRRVHGLELAALVRHLLHDVVGAEDRLEVEPLLLALEPLVDDLLDGVELLLPDPHPVLEGADVGGGPHGLGLDDLVVENHLDVVDALQDLRPRFAPVDVLEGHPDPLPLHLVEGPLQAVLLAGVLAHLLDGLDVLGQLQLQGAVEAEALVRLHGETDGLAHLVPVPVPQARVPQGDDQRQVLLERLQLLLHLPGHVQRLPRELLHRLHQPEVPPVRVGRDLVGVQLGKGAVGPVRQGAHELRAALPQGAVRREGLGDLGQVRVLRLRHLEDRLTGLVHLRQLLGLLQLLLDVRDIRQPLLHLLDLAVCDERLDLGVDRVDLVHELLHVVLQVLLEARPLARHVHLPLGDDVDQLHGPV